MLVHFSNVGFQYGGRPILDGADFTLEAAEVVGLLGLNGTGKTTTMRLIAGILEPSQGQITRQYRRLGYLPEERGLYRRMTPNQYLTFVGRLNGMAARAAGERTRELIERFRLGSYGWVRIETLSKGNQQKVQLAATLVPRPDLMLWDEPFSGLDALNQELLLEVLKELRTEGVTVLLSTHRLDDLALLADRTYILASRRFTEYVPSESPDQYRLRIRHENLERQETVKTERLSDRIAEITRDGATLLAVSPESGLETVFRKLVEHT
ncbi:ABC transporter ATP-binding protein [Sulfobacillus harzensis]|uniref:ATP-binding cassette domain-containing protein n=1 Tax=Sulfobacillus harzensis TaxID=2729629 RepID=A0A7Y0L3E8_9FIRM|nr:ATP-binding cassette domain-containing protein [Sulfobacillus harzensis]NMP21986.1 ATP-binding cassette domain-containing protein [Sulfobacillus harzensis]